MRYFKIDGHFNVVAIAESMDEVKADLDNGGQWAFSWQGQKMEIRNLKPEGGWMCRNDIESWEEAQAIASAANAFCGSPDAWIATDAGEWVSPRYDVIEAPKVGQFVSKGFNGDYYPLGTITKISHDFKRVTVENENGTKYVFYRKKMSGVWLLNRMWGLVCGSVNERNPHL
jgi:hypothetical protein